MGSDLRKAYASSFVSFLLRETNISRSVWRIVLFGSVAKGGAGKDSDVDIFFDVKRKSKVLEKSIEKLLSSFYGSREAVLFKSRGIYNKINVVVGKLDEWKELRKSIESTGLVLYGSYVGSSGGTRKYLIIFWDGIRKNRGAFLNKIYGFGVGGKRYKGLVEEFGGRRIGKSSVMIPVEFMEDFEVILKKYEVNSKVIEVWV